MTRLSTTLLILFACASPASAQSLAVAQAAPVAQAQVAPGTVQGKAAQKVNNNGCGAQPEASGPFCKGRRYHPKPARANVIPFAWGYWPAARG